jgi:hypothetical protein
MGLKIEAMDVTMLKTKVREWLRAKPGPMTTKARELGVSYFWLQRFMKGQIDNVTTDRLQFLVERMESEHAAKPRQKKLPTEARAG